MPGTINTAIQVESWYCPECGEVKEDIQEAFECHDGAGAVRQYEYLCPICGVWYEHDEEAEDCCSEHKKGPEWIRLSHYQSDI